MQAHIQTTQIPPASLSDTVFTSMCVYKILSWVFSPQTSGLTQRTIEMNSAFARFLLGERYKGVSHVLAGWLCCYCVKKKRVCACVCVCVNGLKMSGEAWLLPKLRARDGTLHTLACPCILCRNACIHMHERQKTETITACVPTVPPWQIYVNSSKQEIIFGRPRCSPFQEPGEVQWEWRKMKSHKQMWLKSISHVSLLIHITCAFFFPIYNNPKKGPKQCFILLTAVCICQFSWLLSLQCN